MIKTTRLLQQIPVTLGVVEEYIQSRDCREDKPFIWIPTPAFLLLRRGSASPMLLLDGSWMPLQSHQQVLFGHSETAGKGRHLVTFFPLSHLMCRVYLHICSFRRFISVLESVTNRGSFLASVSLHLLVLHEMAKQPSLIISWRGW